MADKHFKIKNNLVVSDLTISGPIVRHTDGTLLSHTTLPIDKGGTGQTSATNAINALLPIQTSANNKFLSSDGTSPLWAIPAYSYISYAGTPVSSRQTLNFIGAVVSDDPLNNATNVTISSSGTQYQQVWLVEKITGMTIL